MDALPIFVINLKSAYDRWQESTQQLRRMGLVHERFDATDGYQLAEEEINAHFARETSRKWCYDLSPPEVGCYLSHWRVWKHIVDSRLPGAFVLEDDFQAASEFPEIIRALSRLEFARPSLITLYHDRPPAAIVKNKFLIGHHRLVTPYRVPWGAVAYYLNLDAARVLCDRRRIFCRQNDTDMRYYWETGIDVKTVIPSPVALHSITGGSGTLDIPRRRTRARYWKTTHGKYRIITRKLTFEFFNLIHTPSRILRSLWPGDSIATNGNPTCPLG